MDITVLFKACVDLARKQSKDVGKILTDSTDSSSGPGKNGCLPGKPVVSTSKLFPGKKSEYYSQARDLLTTLSGLKKYLQETRNPYLHIGSHTQDPNEKSKFTKNPNVFSKGNHPSQTLSELTNAERDQVDQDVQQIIQTCQKRIFEFQKMIEITGSEQKQPQLFTHLENISNSLGVYLKEICTYYSEMRAIRVKRTVDFQAMSKLTSSRTPGEGHNSNSSSSTSLSKKRNYESSNDTGVSKDKFPKPGASTSQGQSQVDLEYQMSPAAVEYFEEDEELSPEEIQLLEAENVQLFNELHTLSDEVNQIQRSVVKIAELQTIFTEKVLEQGKTIDNITNVVVGTTENIKGGNEQIRQAIQQSADFRAWVLFFIIVMSLSLLFLDWYND